MFRFPSGGGGGRVPGQVSSELGTTEGALVRERYRTGPGMLARQPHQFLDVYRISGRRTDHFRHARRPDQPVQLLAHRLDAVFHRVEAFDVGQLERERLGAGEAHGQESETVARHVEGSGFAIGPFIKG